MNKSWRIISNATLIRINFIFISEYTTKLWSWGLCRSSSKMPTGAFCPKQRRNIIETCPCKTAKWEGGQKTRGNGAIAQMMRFVFFFICLFAFLHQNQYSSLQFFLLFCTALQNWSNNNWLLTPVPDSKSGRKKVYSL